MEMLAHVPSGVEAGSLRAFKPPPVMQMAVARLSRRRAGMALLLRQPWTSFLDRTRYRSSARSVVECTDGGRECRPR